MSSAIDMGPAPTHYEFVVGSSSLFEIQNKRIVVSETFEALLGVLHSAELIDDSYRSDLNGALQKGVLRAGERWHAQQEDRVRKVKPITDKVLDYVDKLGFVTPRALEGLVQVDEVVVFGARVERMRLRIQQTLELEKKGLLSYKQAALLGSSRPLTDEERALFPENPPEDEAEAMVRIWKEESSQHATVIRSTEVGVSYEETKGWRPTTQSTLNDWVVNCTAESVFAVVELPYLRLADQLRWTLFKNGKEVKVLSAHPESSTNDPLIYLDEVARHVYELTKRLNEN